MKPHNFKITGGDTDSIMFCKPDMSFFSEKEQAELIDEINNLLPGIIKFANDGVFPRVVYLKSKNYCMIDSKGKRKIKGSSLKSSTLEPDLKVFLNEMLDLIIADKMDQLVPTYNKYIKLIMNITDIKPWAKKMSLSPTTFKSTRTNETKVVDAIKGSEYGSGDRIYVYPTNDGKLKLAERYNNDHDVDIYLKKLYNTTKRFETIMDVKSMFVNYSLKGKKQALKELLEKL